MRDDLENPIITRTERYGMEEPEECICPWCEDVTERYAVRDDGEIVGCEECVKFVTAWPLGD